MLGKLYKATGPGNDIRRGEYIMKRNFLRIALCTMIMAIMGSTYIKRDQNNHVWVKIQAKDKFQRSLIANMGIAIEKSDGHFVFGFANASELKQLKASGIIHEVFAVTPEEFPPEDRAFHTYTEVRQALELLNKTYPNITQLYSIGKSIEGRDLLVLQIQTSQQPMPAAFFMGGHHAREHLSVDTPLRILEKLLKDYQDGVPAVRQLLNQRSVYFLPAVNPDGLEYDIQSNQYKYWRKNRRKVNSSTYGVDLNRNYEFFWGTGGSSKNPDSETFMGPQPFSEPETIAIKNFIEAHPNIKTLLSFHTFSKLILYPWGHSYNPVENQKDHQVFQAMAKTMAGWNGYTPQQASELYIASGDTTDWAYGRKGIFAFTFELDPGSDYGFSGFYPGASVIQDVVNKNYNPVLYMIDLAYNPYRAVQ